MGRLVLRIMICIAVAQGARMTSHVTNIYEWICGFILFTVGMLGAELMGYTERE